VRVEADVFTDGHDAVHCELLWRFSGEKQWNRVPMEFRHNDHWVAAFRVEQLGRYQYTVRAWTDPWLTWQRDLVKRRAAGQDLTIDLQIGARLLGKEIPDYEAAMAAQAPPPRAEWVLTFEKNLEVVVDPVRARFSAWYEVFPRSFGGFRGMVELLPYVERLGFDILYLPPVHPVGVTKRKGKNNAVASEAGDVGSPWAIGASEGGHKAVNPELGTLADFDLRKKTSRSLSTLPSSARPTIPTSSSTRSGSARAPTARSSTPRTRRRSTRTSIRSTSRARTGPSSGPS
jgi:starch synthase (maltosyl-transferring)